MNHNSGDDKKNPVIGDMSESVIDDDITASDENPYENNNGEDIDHDVSAPNIISEPWPFQIDENNRILFNDDVVAQWRADIDNVPDNRMQGLLLHLIKQRFFWRLVRYLRLYPEKLVSDSNTYTDNCVGGDEVIRYMGVETDDNYAHRWLDDHHVPPVDVAEHELIVLNEQIAITLDKCRTMNDSKVPIALISQRFNLNSTELEILSTLVIAMSDETCMRMLAVAWADFSIRQPTVTFICHFIADPVVPFHQVYRAFDENGILRRMRLIIPEKNARYPNYTPLHFAPLALEQRVIDAFCGFCSHHHADFGFTGKFVSFQRLILDKNIRAELCYALKKTSPRLCLIGPPHAGRRTVAASAVYHVQKMRVTEVDACRTFNGVHPDLIADSMAAMLRDALLDAGTLLLRFDDIDDCPDLLNAMMTRSDRLIPLFTQYPGTLIIIARSEHRFIDTIFGTPAIIHIQVPIREIAEDIWRTALSPWCDKVSAAKMAEMFARNYEIPVGQIFNIVRNVAGSAVTVKNDDPFESHRVLAEIRRTFEHNLGTLADITVSDVPLDGVVLTPDAKSQVDEILAYAKNLNNVLYNWGFLKRSPYGNALSVLFTGPPGTGKTLLACALANTLGKVLYRVDLSRIVDKYIGETEKNLGKIFDEAARAQAIILFDEADSLFAKRTSVQSSNDRYANLEINFLLQKLESYNGMTILTTNLSKSIDEAFKRRIRFIVEFPMPDAAARKKLWQRMIPPDAPIADDIRWSWLASTFEMSGGYIRNAVLKAAITASSEGEPISMRHLSKAAADVARSMGKLMRIEEKHYDEDRMHSADVHHNEYADADFYDDYDDYDDTPGYRDEDA